MSTFKSPLAIGLNQISCQWRPFLSTNIHGIRFAIRKVFGRKQHNNQVFDNHIAKNLLIKAWKYRRMVSKDSYCHVSVPKPSEHTVAYFSIVAKRGKLCSLYFNPHFALGVVWLPREASKQDTDDLFFGPTFVCFTAGWGVPQNLPHKFWRHQHSSMSL